MDAVATGEEMEPIMFQLFTTGIVNESTGVPVMSCVYAWLLLIQ